MRGCASADQRVCERKESITRADVVFYFINALFISYLKICFKQTSVRNNASVRLFPRYFRNIAENVSGKARNSECAQVKQAG